MKKIALFISILILLCSATISKENLFKGKWEIITWIDSRNNTDILKTQGAPNYVIRFKKKSVHVCESEKGKKHKYEFNWTIKNDSLEVSSLGTFKIKLLNENKCILEINTRNIFTEEKELHIETLTLIKK
jgi:hypothetical protein